MEEEKKIVLTEAELELLKRIEQREYEGDFASPEEQALELALLDKASEYEDSDESFIDERCDYTRDANLLIWYLYRYRLQEGLCPKWDGKQTDL